MKIRPLVLFAVLATSVIACATSRSPEVIRLEPRQPQPPMSDMSRLAKAVTSQLAQHHYAPPVINDEFSEKTFDLFLDLYDPYRLFLTEEDIGSLSQYRTFIDDELKTDRLVFPWVVSELISRRAEEFSLFAQRYLDQNKIDLSTDQEVTFFKRATDSVSQIDLWESYVKNEVLRVRVARELAKHPELHSKNIRKEHAYLAQFPESRRVMLRLNQMTYPYRFPPQRAAAETLLTAVALTVDPHGIYSAPKDFERRISMLNLTFAGIGIQYSMEDGVCQVKSVLPNGPCGMQKIDIKADDILLSVMEENSSPIELTGLPAMNVSNFIRGPKSSKLTMTLVPFDDPDSRKVVTVIRNDIVTEDARASVTRELIKGEDGEKAIAIVRLPGFYQRPNGPNGEKHGCSDDVRRLLKQMQKDSGEIDGIILDLRNNGGGLLSEALGMASLFIPAGPVVQIRDRHNVNILTCQNADSIFTQPLIVLINKRSASASEIVAGVLKDYGRALIVGDERTFGKGTVQRVVDLTPLVQRMGLPHPPGGINLTTAKFYRVNGETTQCQGVPADILLPSSSNLANEGEANIKGAMPFDTIKPAQYQRIAMDIKPLIPALQEKSSERIKGHQFFIPHDKPVVQDTQLRAIYSPVEQKVNLSFDKTWDRVVVETQKMKAQENAPKVSTDSHPFVYVKDPYVDESLLIISDWIKLQK